LKIAFDENIPSAMVKAFQAFANERQFRREVGAFEIRSARDYAPRKSDKDYAAKNDVPWLKRFAADGGKVIISGDTKMRNVPHERLALIEAGFVVVFFESQWSNWKFFRKCALLLHWWPVIAKTIRRARAKSFFHIPCTWQEDGKLRRVSNRDPRELKIERRQTAARKRKAATPNTKAKKPALPNDPTLLDLMVIPPQPSTTDRGQIPAPQVGSEQTPDTSDELHGR
jgi:hypothetical protein